MQREDILGMQSKQRCGGNDAIVKLLLENGAEEGGEYLLSSATEEISEIGD